MSLIGSLVEGIVAGIPKNKAEQAMRDAHDKWMRTAELHRPYWTDDARYIWADQYNPTLVCLGEYTFVRRDKHHLYTRDGAASWDLWFHAGPRGLTGSEPPKPPKGQRYHVSGDLRDAAHPERWDITHY